MIALVSNLFKKNFKKSQETKISQQMLNKYKDQKLMCGYFCIEFINFMLKGKRFLDYTDL